MENQHRQIKGYRELSQAEIDLMNRIKTQGIELQTLLDDVSKFVNAQVPDGVLTDDQMTELLRRESAEPNRWIAAEPNRWIAIAQTNLQQGLMALTRSVAQPTFF